jgi:hypothetical protein
MIKRTLTHLAVDSARDYLREKLAILKQLDLDEDGQKDVDQITGLLTRVGEKAKLALESTNFQQLATGLEQVISGAGLIGASVDREKFSAASAELATTLVEVGKLLQLGLAEVKRYEQRS